MYTSDLKDLIRADLETAMQNASDLDNARDADDYSHEWRERLKRHIQECLDLL